MTTGIFAPKQLQHLIDESLPTDAIPGEKVVVGTIDKTGAQVLATFKWHSQKATWELKAAARHDWSGDNNVEAKVILRWS